MEENQDAREKTLGKWPKVLAKKDEWNILNFLLLCSGRVLQAYLHPNHLGASAVIRFLWLLSSPKTLWSGKKNTTWLLVFFCPCWISFWKHLSLSPVFDKQTKILIECCWGWASLVRQVAGKTFRPGGGSISPWISNTRVFPVVC